MTRRRIDDRIRDAANAGLAAVAEGMGVDTSPQALAPVVHRHARAGINLIRLSALAAGRHPDRHTTDPETDAGLWEASLPDGLDPSELIGAEGWVRLDRLRAAADGVENRHGLAQLIAAVGAFVPHDGTIYLSRALRGPLVDLDDDERDTALRYASALVIDPRGEAGTARHASRELLDALPPLEMTYTPKGGAPVTSRLILRIAAGWDSLGYEPVRRHRPHPGVSVSAVLVFDGPSPEGWSDDDRQGYWSAWRELYPYPDDDDGEIAARPSFDISFARFPIDTGVRQALRALRWFPSVAHNVPLIDVAEGDEVAKWVEQYGGEDAARRAIADYSKNPTGEAPPLTIRRGELALADDRFRELREAMSLRDGYREIDRQGREWLVRGRSERKGSRRTVRETMLSIDGAATPLSEEGGEMLRREIGAMEHRRAELEQANSERLYEETPPRAIEAMRKQAEAMTYRAEAMEDAKKLLHTVALLPAQYQTTRVSVSVYAMKNALGISAKDARGTTRLKDAFAMMGRIELSTRGAGGRRKRHAVLVRPIHDVEFVAPTRAGGDGDIEFTVSERFLGELRDVYTPRRDAAGVLDVVDGARMPAGKYDTVPSILPFASAAYEWAPRQTAMRDWLDEQITELGDAARSSFPGWVERDGVRSIGESDAHEARTYTSRFCPLLPEGKRYCGALGHFKAQNNPEHGWLIAGTGKDGPAPRGGEGLLEHLGLTIRGVRSTSKRRAVYAKALDTMREIVVETFGGVVAGLLDDEWITLDDIEQLGAQELRRVRLYPFLPEDWGEREIEGWEDRMRDRHASGDEPHPWRAARTQEEADRAKRERRGRGVDGADIGERRRELGLSQEQAAKLLGIGRAMLGHWETGRKPINPERESAVRAFLAGELVPPSDDDNGDA